jgi:DNA uptake protein ComE-like DNA-binding protein
MQLNAHSSRSHAILCVKLTQITEDQTLVSTASAIDLAGSEDNRRTENNKDRMVESASINKSLFVLAQCVEAISKKQFRIPYRESKMTRILSLGQNNGLTVMILNLAPLRSYQLDTLSSLNFANRTKKIEVNEIENEPIFRGPAAKASSLGLGDHLSRQPLRQLNATENIPVQPKRTDKPVKTFAVFTDRRRSNPTADAEPRSMLIKRPPQTTSITKPSKAPRAGEPKLGLSKADIEEMIERRVDQKFAEKALTEKVAPVQGLPDSLQRRLDELEQRVSEKESSEGLQYLLMARQHQARGEDGSALKMYQLAQPYFPNNAKLQRKINNLEALLAEDRESQFLSFSPVAASSNGIKRRRQEDDNDYEDDHDYADEAADSFGFKSKPRKVTKSKVEVLRDNGPPSPRSQMLLNIINTKDVSQIKGLKGVGAKKAEAIISSLVEMGNPNDTNLITDLEQLGALRGVGRKMVENMRLGIC